MLKGWAWQAIGLTLTMLGFSLGGEAQTVLDSQNKLATSRRQAPELITDRPDKTESAVTVPPGYVQLETGWTFTREDEGGVRLGTHDVPGTLVRIGIVRWMELRIGWNGYTSEKVRVGSFQARESGIGDTELGVKIHLRSESEEALLPEMAFLMGTSLPSGNDSFSTQRADPSFLFSLAHSISERVGLGYNVGMAWESGVNEAGRRTTLSNYLYSLAVGVGLSDRWGSFVEVFGEIPGSSAGGPANSFDGGFTYLLRKNVQLDFGGGVGLSRAAEDWFVGAGLSLRLPE